MNIVHLIFFNMDEHTEPVGEQYRYDGDYHKMSDFLGVNIYDRSDDGLAKKVSALHDWASDKTGKKDLNSVLLEVSKLQKSLGVHFIGKPLVTELYKHMRLSQVNQKPQAALQVKVPSMRKKNNTVKGILKQQIQSTVTQAIKDAFK